MILLVDNYDSFSYNLYQLVGALNSDIKVVRNDAIDADAVRQAAPSHIILSPGPGRPSGAGACEEIVRSLSDSIPILGVCLGHQAICEAFGATIGYARELMHGKQSNAKLDTNCPLFTTLDRQIKVGRYHSLSVEEDTLPNELNVVARADDGEVMAVAHETYPTFGLQFHPESILTREGSDILQAFLAITV